MGNGVVRIAIRNRRWSLWRGQSSALVCDSIEYGMACLPEELFRVVWCWMRSSIFCYVQLARFGARMRSDRKMWLPILNGALGWRWMEMLCSLDRAWAVH